MRQARKIRDLTHKYAQVAQLKEQKLLALEGRGTEAGVLSGISRKRSIRSNPYWFTEFCNSQCLSRFAAPFIVVRAETSVAESCEIVFEWRATREGMEIQEERFKRNPAAGMALDKSSPTLLPSSFWAGNFSLPRTSQTRCTVVRLDACE